MQLNETQPQVQEETCQLLESAVNTWNAPARFSFFLTKPQDKFSQFCLWSLSKEKKNE